MVEHLYKGTDTNGRQKGDDQHRDGAPQEGLGVQETPIGRLGD
jgi:hypothetical protein